LAGFQKGHLPGVLENGRDIRSDEHFPASHPDHHSAGVAQPRSDDLVRLAGRKQHHPVSPLKVAQSLAGGLDESAVERLVAFDQLSDDLGIRVGSKRDTLGGKFLP